MEYRWRGMDAKGREVSGAEVTFVSQAEAETWLSENWRDLLGGGVDAVTLLHGEMEVYGPMSLHPAD